MKTNCLTNNVSDMNIENFEMFLRQEIWRRTRLQLISMP